MDRVLAYLQRKFDPFHLLLRIIFIDREGRPLRVKTSMRVRTRFSKGNPYALDMCKGPITHESETQGNFVAGENASRHGKWQGKYQGSGCILLACKDHFTWQWVRFKSLTVGTTCRMGTALAVKPTSLLLLTGMQTYTLLEGASEQSAQGQAHPREQSAQAGEPHDPDGLKDGEHGDDGVSGASIFSQPLVEGGNNGGLLTGGVGRGFVTSLNRGRYEVTLGRSIEQRERATNESFVLYMPLRNHFRDSNPLPIA